MLRLEPVIRTAPRQITWRCALFGTILRIVAISVMLAGCKLVSLPQALIPPAEQTFAGDFVELLRTGNLDAADSELSTRNQSPEIRAGIAKVAAIFPPGEVLSVDTTNWRHTHFTSTNRPSVDQTDFEFQYHIANEWLLADVILIRQDDRLFVDGVRATPMSGPLQELNRFTVVGKPTGNYLFLAVTIAMPLFIIYALVACVRTRGLRRKWLWIIFILLGVGVFVLNWTTGRLAINPLYVQILGAGFTRSGFYGPWHLAVSIPVGAIVFLLRRQALARQQDNPA